MKFFLSFLLPLTIPFVSVVGQSVQTPKAAQSLLGYRSFHSNLGLQEIIEVGAPVNKGNIGDLPEPPVSEEVENPQEKTSKWFSGESFAKQGTTIPKNPSTPPKPLPFDFSISGGVKVYQTNNVLRTGSGTEGSGVLETNLGTAVTVKPKKVGQYFTFIPRLDLMMQWANYGEYGDLLDYRFGMAKASLAIGMLSNWSSGIALEYNSLTSQESGNKMFHAVSPSISLQKIIPFNEKSFLMIDTTMRFSNTNRRIDFVAEGIFADDGDNVQNSLNLSYIKIFGDSGKWMLMPSIGITRSGYLKNNQDGRVDLLYNAGITGIYQWQDWLGFQTFLNYSSMSTNSKGESIPVSTFNAVDIGLAISGNYRF